MAVELMETDRCSFTDRFTGICHDWVDIASGLRTFKLMCKNCCIPPVKEFRKRDWSLP